MGADDTDTELGTENKAVNKTGKISVFTERSFQTGRQKMDCKWGEEPCGRIKEERGTKVCAAYLAREDLRNGGIFPKTRQEQWSAFPWEGLGENLLGRGNSESKDLKERHRGPERVPCGGSGMDRREAVQVEVREALGTDAAGSSRWWQGPWNFF